MHIAHILKLWYCITLFIEISIGILVEVMELEATVKEMNWDLTIMNGKMTMRWNCFMLLLAQRTDCYQMLCCDMHFKWNELCDTYKFCEVLFDVILQHFVRSCCRSLVKIFDLFSEEWACEASPQPAHHVADLCTERVFERGWGT